MEPREIKQNLYDACLNFVNKRIDTIQEAIMSAREAANEETKSSSGDKYETGRAMMQLEIENNITQLKEAQRLSDEMRAIRPGRHSDFVQTGNLIKTNNGFYYMAISAGKIQVDGVDYFAIAPNSPIGQFLMDLKAGESFEFNGRKFEIIEIY